jgi:hypothetical protein
VLICREHRAERALRAHPHGVAQAVGVQPALLACLQCGQAQAEGAVPFVGVAEAAGQLPLGRRQGVIETHGPVAGGGPLCVQRERLLGVAELGADRPLQATPQCVLLAQGQGRLPQGLPGQRLAEAHTEASGLLSPFAAHLHRQALAQTLAPQAGGETLAVVRVAQAETVAHRSQFQAPVRQPRFQQLAMAEKGLRDQRLPAQRIAHHHAGPPIARDRRGVLDGEGAGGHIEGLAQGIVDVELHRAGHAGAAGEERQRLADEARRQIEVAGDLDAAEVERPPDQSRARGGVAQAHGELVLREVARECGLQPPPLGRGTGLRALDVAPQKARSQHAKRARETRLRQGPELPRRSHATHPRVAPAQVVVEERGGLGTAHGRQGLLLIGQPGRQKRRRREAQLQRLPRRIELGVVAVDRGQGVPVLLLELQALGLRRWRHTPGVQGLAWCMETFGGLQQQPVAHIGSIEHHLQRHQPGRRGRLP